MYRIKAPAKINLYLGVYPELDERCYHRVDSVMAALDLYDEIDLVPAETLSVTCIPQVDFPEHTNSCYKAVQLMQETFKHEQNFAITIHKHIPFKSGLGGASSDAAAVIYVLCQLWNINHISQKVLKVAQKLGADTPFFLLRSPMLLQGAGDVPTRTYTHFEALPLVLVRPRGDGITAFEAYQEFDKQNAHAMPLATIEASLTKPDKFLLAEAISNNLEPIALRLMPDLSDCLEWLQDQEGTYKAMVTGSGSCIYAFCKSVEFAQNIAEVAKKQGWWSCQASIINESPSLNCIGL